LPAGRRSARSFATLDPERVALDDKVDVATFLYDDVAYAYDRERELVHEHRADSYRAFIREGTIGWLTKTHAGTDQLAHCLSLPTPPRPEHN